MKYAMMFWLGMFSMALLQLFVLSVEKSECETWQAEGIHAQGWQVEQCMCQGINLNK
jgi:hypothetical protein